MSATEVIYPFYTVLCNSISHLAWAEGDTHTSQFQYQLPKVHVQSRTLQFNLNGLHQSQSWGKSISNWPKSLHYLKWQCIVYMCRLSDSDSAKRIWLNDIRLKHITSKLASPSWVLYLLRVVMPQVSGPRLRGEKCSQQEVKSIHISWDLITLISVKNSYNPANVCVSVNSSSHRDESVLIRKWKCKHIVSECERERVCVCGLERERETGRKRENYDEKVVRRKEQ